MKNNILSTVLIGILTLLTGCCCDDTCGTSCNNNACALVPGGCWNK